MSDPDAAAEPPANRARRGVAGVTGMLIVYYAVPIRRLPSGSGVILSALVLLAGTALLGWAIVHQVRRLVDAGVGAATVRLDSLILLVVMVVPLFAVGYYALESSDASQFESLATKTDALYFALSTLATVGFGDVHAAGQVARVLVTVQIAFDLVFVAALVSAVSGAIRERAGQRRAA